MSIRSAIMNRLVERTSVSGRVHLTLAPSGETLPYITIFWVDGVPDYHLGGPSGLIQRRLQADCYAVDSPGAEAVADSVWFALGALRFTDIDEVRIQDIMLDLETDVPEPPQQGTQQTTAHIRHEYIIWHEHAVPVN